MSNKSDNENNRIEWISKTLKSIKSDSRILDAGAGEQFYKQFCGHLKYVSQDFGKYNPAESTTGLQMEEWNYNVLDITSDITSIPEPNESFDAILCAEVFEHIHNPLLAIKEFYRLLKKDGTLIITAPFCSLTHFSPYHYYSGFNKYFYEKVLPENGFKIIELNINGNYFDYLKQEISRVNTVTQKYNHSKISFLENKALGVVSRLLSRLSQNDTGSNELLNFGFHILAQKT